ncbi:MAG: PEP-CTERM sorting domain-containing protein [Syntrophobacteraceae bacterium]
MKLRTLLPAFLLILGVALGVATHADADYVLWTPTTSADQNVFSFQPQNCTMTGGLYINAAGVTQGINITGNALLLSMPGSAHNPYSAQAVDFTIAETGTTWYVYSGAPNANDIPSNALLNLGSTNQFGLYYYYIPTGGTQLTVVQPVLTNLGQSDEWLLNTPDACLPVYLTDAAQVPEVASPTPLPGTFLLFGSGLAGVFGFLRRFSS